MIIGRRANGGYRTMVRRDGLVNPTDIRPGRAWRPRRAVAAPAGEQPCESGDSRSQHRSCGRTNRSAEAARPYHQKVGRGGLAAPYLPVRVSSHASLETRGPSTAYAGGPVGRPKPSAITGLRRPIILNPWFLIFHSFIEVARVGDLW